MKIKEVIKETGLTDRAIRLYMENDLIKPEYDENYNGRKSIDFSENDVVQLKNIATLRKADFSIQEIKDLQSGGETAQQIVKDYIKRTNDKIQFNTEIIEKIGTLADEKNITIEIICEKLSNNLADEKVPVEDMELSPKEQKEKTIFTVISVVGIVVSLIPIIIVFMAILDCYKYPSYINIDINDIHSVGDFFYFILMFMLQFCYLVQFILSFVLFYIYKKNKRIGKKKNSKKKISIFLSIIISISVLLTPFTFLLHTFSYESKTDNPNNYLRTDWGISEEVSEIFPSTIPTSADWNSTIFGKTYPKTTKYFYRYYDDVFGGSCYEWFAEWKLDEYEYIEEKDRISNIKSVLFEKSIGNWQCVYFVDDKIKSDPTDDYYHEFEILFFAYNDKTQTVRYSYTSAYKYFDEPYYESLEW
ncbi:MAG: MerR family transcriptional regulator [Clostridia bacterium]|nr:MerR family transcriptional regulator [Clostridia bacterium]